MMKYTMLKKSILNQLLTIFLGLSLPVNNLNQLFFKLGVVFTKNTYYPKNNFGKYVVSFRLIRAMKQKSMCIQSFETFSR